MIIISNEIQINENELQFDFVRASGPGGQNVNKVSTAVQLRFDINNSPSLSEAVKERLTRLAGSRVNSDGILVIDAHRYRTQEQNKADAMRRFINLLQQAANPPKNREATRPSAGARARRLGDKRKRSEKKRFRRYTPEDWEE